MASWHINSSISASTLSITLYETWYQLSPVGNRASLVCAVVRTGSFFAVIAFLVLDADIQGTEKPKN